MDGNVAGAPRFSYRGAQYRNEQRAIVELLDQAAGIRVRLGQRGQELRWPLKHLLEPGDETIVLDQVKVVAIEGFLAEGSGGYH
jgi:hypothetical protein